MKKSIRIFVASLLLASMTVFSLGCSNDNQSGEKIDKNRTQIYVHNYDGGFGSAWLQTVKTEFEAKYAEAEIENGKRGVQVVIMPEKSQYIKEYAKVNKYDVFFNEEQFVQELLAAGAMLDITDAVTGSLKDEFGEDATIESKLNSAQKEYYKVDGKYYALPHYATYSGFYYDYDLFENQNFFFADDAAKSDNGFIIKSTQKKSAGRDGEYGTFDDGLPVTYNDFFKLLDRIDSRNLTPLIWTGKYNVEYLGALYFALATDFEGYDQMLLNYNFGDKGVVPVNLASKINGTGFGATVTKNESVVLSADNGYELSAQEGKLRALQFLEKLIKTEKYYDPLSFNFSQSHIEAQDLFLVSKYEKVKGKKQIAMIMDGSWWENEAEDSLNELALTYGDEAARGSRRFAYMPLPKFSDEQQARYTLYDSMHSIAFVSAAVPEYKKDICIKFLQYVNTEKALKQFTKDTSATKALKYDMTEEDLAQCTFMGRTVYEAQKKSDIVYPYSDNAFYIKNENKFEYKRMLYSIVDNETYNIITGMRSDGKTAEDLFLGMKTYYKNSWSSLAKL